MTSVQTKRRTVFSRKILLIGTKTGKCDICKRTGKVLLLKYGFTLCEDCLSVCTSILEEIQSSIPKKKAIVKHGIQKEKISTVEKPENSKRVCASAKSNDLLKPEVSEA